jgi:hypothetical protein
MFLHPQLFQESCATCATLGWLAHALWTYTLNQMSHINSDDGINVGGHHSSQQGNATSAILVGRAGMF